MHWRVTAKLLFLYIARYIENRRVPKMSHNTKPERMGKVVTASTALTVQLGRV